MYVQSKPTEVLHQTVSDTSKFLSQVGNTAAQLGRIPGGIVKGATKLVIFPALFVESIDSMNTRHMDYKKLGDNLEKVRNSGEMYTQEQLINALSAGEITQIEYDNTINEWRAGNNPYDQAINNSYVAGSPSTPITNQVNKLTSSIDNITNSWVPEPKSKASEFIAKAADITGEAAPNAALAYLTGGGGILATLRGTPLSYAGAFAQGYSSDWLMNKNPSNAILSGAINAGSEWLGGKTIDTIASKVPNKIISKGISIAGEGLEENAGGLVQGALTGQGYSFDDAKEDFLLGAIAGAGINAGVNGINFVKKELGTLKTVKDIQSGKGDGAISGLAKSLEITQNNPEKYGNIARSISVPAIESDFDVARFGEYVKSAVEASGTSNVKVPDNILDINAKNVGGYESLTPAGLKRAASILETAQVGKGLSPRQSGKILKAVLETNSRLYEELGKVSGGSVTAYPVNINRGIDYRNSLPSAGDNNNYSVINMPGNLVNVSPGDRPINIFRGISSEWIIPTLDSGEFVIPNPQAAIETDTPALFSSGAGQMLGAGLYLTSVPSKADQYTSGVANDISLRGRDSSGIMANSVLLGGTTYVSESELSKAERGDESNVVKMGHTGQEKDLASFINSSQGNSEAAAIYSKQGDDYTEIVRPTADKTSLERVYLPSTETTNDAIQLFSQTSPLELGQARAITASEETNNRIGNADIDVLLEKNISPDITPENVSLSPQRVNEEISNFFEESTKENIIEQTIPSEITTELNATSQNETKTEAAVNVNLLENNQTNIATEETVPNESKIHANETAKTTEQTQQSILKETREEQVATELATQIWSPAQAMLEQTTRQNLRQRRDRDISGYDFNLSVGQGSTGRIYETSGYNATFGGLSSY